MKIEGYTIIDKGDPSVGIFPREFKITGDFGFDTEAEAYEFECKLQEAFEYATDVPKVIRN